MRRCPAMRCPKLIPTNQRYCAQHLVEYETRRGTTTQRGYGTRHQRARLQWARRIANHPIPCSRCGQPITASDDWHLDHEDEDRTRYLGPAHAHCNTSAGGQRSTKFR